MTFLAEEVSNSRNIFYQPCSRHFEMLVNRPVRPMQTILAGFLYVPAFQAGCREFESRLPLFSMDRCSQSAPQAVSEEANSDKAWE